MSRPSFDRPGFIAEAGSWARRAALVAALAGLAGCAVAPETRDDSVAEAPVIATPPTSAEPTKPPRDDIVFSAPDGEEVGGKPDAPKPRSVWSRLRRGFAFARCDADDDATRWQRTYSRGAKQFTAMLAKSLPFLQLVLDEAERRRIPTEFVLLPIVESQYTPFASTGNRPAGIWQIMPATARGRGLTVGAGYDARLDIHASTEVALDLIGDLGERFGDWRLANMAFNAGEYRIERALAEARKRQRRPQPEHLAVSPITHEHLAKLNALACLVQKPKRFGVTLPRPTPADRLARVVPDETIELLEVAKAAGIDAATIRRFNPAFRGTIATRGRTILVPVTQHGAFVAAMDRVGAASSAAIAQDTAATKAADPPAADARYVVRSGDSLWTIARDLSKRGLKVSVATLQAWNRLPNGAKLRIGQVLRIAAP